MGTSKHPREIDDARIEKNKKNIKKKIVYIIYKK